MVTNKKLSGVILKLKSAIKSRPSWHLQCHCGSSWSNVDFFVHANYWLHFPIGNNANRKSTKRVINYVWTQVLRSSNFLRVVCRQIILIMYFDSGYFKLQYFSCELSVKFAKKLQQFCLKFLQVTALDKNVPKLWTPSKPCTLCLKKLYRYIILSKAWLHPVKSIFLNS